MIVVEAHGASAPMTKAEREAEGLLQLTRARIELTLGLVAQVCECNTASRERGHRAIRRLGDFADDVEGPGKEQGW